MPLPKDFAQALTRGYRVFLFSVDGYNLGLVAPINPQDIRTSEVPCASSDWPILENRKTLHEATKRLHEDCVLGLFFPRVLADCIRSRLAIQL